MLARRANGSQTLGKVQSGLIVGPFWAGEKQSEHLAKESEMSCFQQKRTMLWCGHRVRAVVVGMRSVMLVCMHCDSVFVSIAFTNRASLMNEMWAAMLNAKRSSQSCSRRPSCWQERTAAQSRAASALSVTRPRTATISRLTTFQAHVSNGFKSGLEAAWTMTRPVPADWCKVCILVVRAWPSPWLVCVSCILTAEQRPACLVQHGLVPLERFLRLVRRRVVHDEKPAWQNHGRQTRHDEILHHVQSLSHCW